jgi:hypothetical protein
MKTKTLTCGIRIDDNRSINCGVSITNQSNKYYSLWYNQTLNEFAFTANSEPTISGTHSVYMSDVNNYLTALNDIITAMAEANEFVAGG